MAAQPPVRPKGCDLFIIFFESIEYKGYILYIVETLSENQHKLTGETEKIRFVHVTNITLGENNVHRISQTGRLRWKIENEGFNNQKNNGYNAEHKFSRTNFNAKKTITSFCRLPVLSIN